SQEQLDKIEYLLNHRPRKCRGFKTPYQVFLKRTGAIPP
ncbi:IS30 family transposase, partial [Coxiella burnetii]